MASESGGGGIDIKEEGSRKAEARGCGETVTKLHRHEGVEAKLFERAVRLKRGVGAQAQGGSSFCADHVEQRWVKLVLGKGAKAFRER